MAFTANKNNHLIHQLYVRQDFEDCVKLIDQVLEESKGQAEYALHVKALIKRQEGKIQESLQLFQQATALNPHNVSNLKQVGRSLFLLGKHRSAVDVYDEAHKVGGDDWELWHNKGLCYAHLKDTDKALDAFKRANAVQPHDATFLQMGQLHAAADNYEAAIATYLEALELSPESSEILTSLGLLFLRMGDNQRAFDHLGTSLLHDPRNVRTILAAGSIIQDHQDMDVALVKYRVAAAQNPNSAQLWNNIGMCFFGKQRYIAAIACLKRALYLGPFEWIISYNLGLVLLNTGQYASAFHHFSCAVNLEPGFAHSYMYLGLCLSHLEDPDNACAAYEKALQLEPSEPLFHINYAITLHNQGNSAAARAHYADFRRLFDALRDEARSADPDLIQAKQKLEQALGVPG